MEPSFKIQARGAVLNLKKTPINAKFDRSRTPGVVWDIKQKEDKDPLKEREKQEFAFKRALKKKKQNIQNLLDEPLPPIYETPKLHSSRTSRSTATHSGRSRKGHSPSPLPKLVNKSSCSRNSSPWVSKNPTKTLSHRKSRHSLSTSEDSSSCSTLHMDVEKTFGYEDIPDSTPEAPFELKYLRWSQNITRSTFSYYH